MSEETTTRRDFFGECVTGAAFAGRAFAGQGDPPTRRPNILFLMTDQMQGRALDSQSPCQAPHLRKLGERGVRFARTYAANPVCSPSRASLMTGLLPHSHGVVQVTHCTFPDQAVLRTDKPHWAQRLATAGYRTGYFGKWHVERSNDLKPFGWQTSLVAGTREYEAAVREIRSPKKTQVKPVLRKTLRGIPGYPDITSFYEVSERPARTADLVPRLASRFLDDVLRQSQPWCCFVSVVEPHDPYIAHPEWYSRYRPSSFPVPPNWNDNLAGRPAVYRKSARTFASLTTREKQEAAACYYAMISAVDHEYGKLIDQVDRAGQLDNTIVVFTADHGDFLGAHGLYEKNVSAFEEAYNIPLIIAAPGCARGVVSEARVGNHDIAPTLLELAGLDPIGAPDSRSFVPALRDPAGQSSRYQTGFAENYGTRYWFTQRVVWDGPWKLAWNGFDLDELYNLRDDPYEMHNLAEEPNHQERVREMMKIAWRIVRDTGDTPLWNSEYPILRLASYGPGVLGDS